MKGDENNDSDDDQTTIVVPWIEEWRNNIKDKSNNQEVYNNNNNTPSSDKYNSFLKKILTLESNSNLKNILNLNEHYKAKENKEKEKDSNTTTSTITTSTENKKYIRNKNNNLTNFNNNNEIIYITSPLSNESLEYTEECCFFLVNLPITKNLIFNQFTCLLIHLFQIEYNNSIIVNNATTTTTSTTTSNLNNNNDNNTYYKSNHQYNNRYNNYNYNNNNYNNNNNNNLKIKNLEGYQECNHLKKLCLMIHDYLIQLLQRNPVVWYDSILEWSLSTITILTRLLKTFKNNKLYQLQQKLSKNKSTSANSISTTNTSISIIVKERLEYYSFKSLLSLVLHLTRELPIERFIKKSNVNLFLDNSTKSTTENELGWILCHLGKKNPSLILDLAFNYSLKNIENYNNVNNNNSNNNYTIQDINCFQILEFLATQPGSYLSIIFQQHIDKIITNHKNNNSSQFIKDIKIFLMLISKEDSFLNISLPNILDQLSPYGISQFDKINSNVSNNNNSTTINRTEEAEDITEIKDILERLLLGNSQVIAFHSKRILLALYYCCYSNSSNEETTKIKVANNKIRFDIAFKLLNSIIQDKLEKQLILKFYSPIDQTTALTTTTSQQQKEIDSAFINNLNHHENLIFYLNQIQFVNNGDKFIIEKNNVILNLVCVIGMDSINSSIIILKHIICNLKSSNQFIQYFYTLIESFQMVNSNTIDFFINDIFKSIDTFNHDDLITLLNNLLVLVKSNNINNNNNNNNNSTSTTTFQTFYNNILKSVSSNWVVLLKLIKNPFLVDSNKKIPMEILYHSFNNKYNNNSTSIQQIQISGGGKKQQQELISTTQFLSDREILEIRILLEKILHLILKNLRNLNEANNYDKELLRLKKFENYKNLYLLICNGSLFYFSITMDLLFDYIFSTKADMIIKLPVLCALPSANTLPPPNYPASLDDNGNGNNSNKSDFIIDEKEELYFQQIINPSLPLSQPLIMLPMQSSLLEVNYERKYYHYKFNDMNNPNHIPFTNIPKNIKKRFENDDSDGTSSSIVTSVDDNELSFKKQKKKRNQDRDGGEIDNSQQELNGDTSKMVICNGTSNNQTIIELVKSFEYGLLNNEIDLQSFIKSMVLYDNQVEISINNNNERLKILTNQFLLRVTSSYLEPTYENYLEILPKQSHYERDIYIRNLFQQNPFLYSILEIISIDGRELIKCLEVIKSLLVNEIAYWYQCRNTYSESPYKSSHYQTTIQLVRVLINSEFIVHPLNLSLELFDKIKAEEISYILTSIWNFIKDYQPDPQQYHQTTSTITTTTTTNLKREFNCNTTPYSLTLKSIFHNHIKDLCFHYARFFPKNYN